MLLIISWRRNSAFNAIGSLALWLLFLVPSVINLLFSNELAVDVTRFYQRYPQYKPVDTAASARFLDFQSYSAFVTLQHGEAKQLVDDYYKQVWDRHRQMSRFDLVNPAVNTQNLLNTPGGSGLEDTYRFRADVTRFHRQLSHFCFQPFFAGL